jgi:hypothetical protein
LTGKAPYKFESIFLQRRVCKLSVPCSAAFKPRSDTPPAPDPVP